MTHQPLRPKPDQDPLREEARGKGHQRLQYQTSKEYIAEPTRATTKTWRATPWLLRLARQAEVKMLWLVDDNVRAVQVSYVDHVEETYTLSTMPTAQFLRFLRRAAKDCARTGAVACSVSTTVNPFLTRPRARRRAKEDYGKRPNSRGLDECLKFSRDNGILYG